MVSSVAPEAALGGGGPLVSAPARIGISIRQQAIPLTASRFIAYLPVFQVMRAPAASSMVHASPHPAAMSPSLLPGPNVFSFVIHCNNLLNRSWSYVCRPIGRGQHRGRGGGEGGPAAKALSRACAVQS